MSLFDDASLAMIPSAYKDGKLYSIKPTDGSGDFTFTRGSNLAATRVDENGLIEKGRENLLLQSNQFSTSPWESNQSNREAVVSSGAAGYDGTNDAWLVLDTTGSGLHQLAGGSLTLSGVHTVSVYAKAYSNSRYLGMAGFGLAGGNEMPVFDLVNGTIDMPSTSIFLKDATITSVGNGWYRCSIMFSYSGSSSFSITLCNSATDNSLSGYTYTGTGLNGFYIQDAQLELGLVATDYIETTTTTAQAGILEDMPRLDYSGGASCPSLLLEPSRSNIQPFSEYFGSSFWQKTDVSLDFGYLAPDGTNSAYKITKTGSSAHLVNTTTSGNTGNTKSIYAKTTSGTGTILLFNSVDTYFTITDEWQRFDIQHDGLDFFYAVDFRGTSTLTEILIWGAQSESGSYPTSYIPTYGTSQTRSKDSCKNTTITDFQTSDATIFVDFNYAGPQSGDFRYVFSTENSTVSNFDSIALSVSPSGTLFRFDISGSGISFPFLSLLNGANKALIKFERSTGAVKTFLNGVQINSATATSVPEIHKIALGGRLNPYSGFATDRQLGNAIKQFLVFPTPLTDSECIALTTI